MVIAYNQRQPKEQDTQLITIQVLDEQQLPMDCQEEIQIDDAWYETTLFALLAYNAQQNKDKWSDMTKEDVKSCISNATEISKTFVKTWTLGFGNIMFWWKTV